jgi:hypothetical protein
MVLLREPENKKEEMENKQNKTDEQGEGSVRATQNTERNAPAEETKPACGCCGTKNKKQ